MTLFELYGYSIDKEYSKTSTTSVYRLLLIPFGPPPEPPAPSGFKPIVMFF